MTSEIAWLKGTEPTGHKCFLPPSESPQVAHACRSSTGRRVVPFYVLLNEGRATMSAITATEARKSLFGLIQQVNEDHTTV